MNVLLNPPKRKAGVGERVLGRILLPLFKLLLFLLQPIVRPWLERTARRKNTRLYQDVLKDMKWTRSNLRPEISLVENDLAKGRFATVTVRFQDYTLKITRYYWGDGLMAQVASSCHPDKYFDIGVATKVIDAEAYARARQEPWTLLRTLGDLDSFVCSFDPLLRKHLSAGECEHTIKAIEDYIWREWRVANQSND